MYKSIKPVRLITITIEDTGTTIKYPKVVGMAKNKIERTINKQILDLVQQLREEGEKPDTTVTITHSAKVNRNGVLSILLTLFYYTMHAAHPMQVQKALTFSTLTGESFSFSELFRTKSYYKTRLTQYVKAYIKAEDITLIEDFKAVKDNQEYYLTDDFLYLFYQLYEYTPYVYGFLEIPVPYEIVQPMVSNSSPIRQLTSR